MKLDLTTGKGNISIKYQDEPPPAHLHDRLEKLRSTELAVTLPNGEVLSTKVACHSTDPFCRKAGRFNAVMKLFHSDLEQALAKVDIPSEVKEKANAESKDEIPVEVRQAAKEHYKLSRSDRSKVFQVVCPEFFKNTPERKRQRELAMLQKLTTKYGYTIINDVSTKLPEGGKYCFTFS